MLRAVNGEATPTDGRSDMQDSQLNQIGQRVRRLRAIRNMPQRRLSKMAGLSPSFISQLERGQTGASLSSLVRIASVLGVSAGHLLADEGPQVQVGRRADRHPLTRGGYEEYLLNPRPSSIFEVYRAVFRPGSCTQPEQATHGDSEEICYVISGTVHVYVGDSMFVLGPGDSLMYLTSVPHRAEYRGTDAAELIWVMGPPTIGRTTVPDDRAPGADIASVAEPGAGWGGDSAE
jgi:transcriptional regulator with XRE-family HTH domain